MRLSLVLLIALARISRPDDQAELQKLREGNAWRANRAIVWALSQYLDPARREHVPDALAMLEDEIARRQGEICGSRGGHIHEERRESDHNGAPEVIRSSFSSAKEKSTT